MMKLAKEENINLKEYSDLIETVSKVEFSKVSSYGLIEYPEIVNLATHTIYLILKNGTAGLYNNAYLTKAIKWEVRNEIRRRYRWYTLKNSQPVNNSEVREVVYKTILSVEAMAEADNPVIIKDNSMNPSEQAEFDELKSRIAEAIKHLPERERALVEAKFFQDKKLKDISVEFNISQSRISRIIQNALKKVRKELMKQENE
ncbi:MAG: sigma-70 family RNA polymerase sigma factor [Candidatus Gastranaerophilales bacterium]|nr:sigma-70 family RNA polymerase sigma factor [Candidatus Gastranaerophilales bacterium]